MLNNSHPDVEIIEDRYIRVSCPPAFQGVILHGLGLAFLCGIVVQSWSKASAWTLIVPTLMALFLGAMLYRNLFFRDAIILFKDKAEIEADRLEFHCAAINGIDVEPEPGYLSYEGRMATFGLGRGLIVIRSGDQSARFGIGLTHEQALLVARELRRFCDRCKAPAEVQGSAV